MKRTFIQNCIISLVFFILLSCSKNEDSSDFSSGQILFSTGLYKQPQIYRINSDGTGLVRLTDGHGYYQSAHWSWDCRLMALYSVGGRTDTFGADHDMIYVMDSQGSIVDSMHGGFFEDGRFIWIGQTLKICYPKTLIGSFRGYSIHDCSQNHENSDIQSLTIQNDSATGDMMIFDCHPNHNDRFLLKYQMKEQIVIKDKVSTNYYWRFGEIDAQGEIIQTFCRLDQFNIVKARYSPDGKKIAYMKNANSITISLLSSPDRPVDINFEPSVGYAITAFEWAPNSIDFALSLNQGTQSGIYLYDVTNMILTPVIVSDTTIYLLGDYR